MPENVRIELEEGISLEGEFDSGPKEARAAALILHPHPLYGGDMQNNVVGCLRDAALEAGFAALCINFRGVGDSTGSHGNGEDEVRDVVGAAHWLRRKNFGGLALLGYSFGARVGSKAALGLPGLLAGLWVAPPFALGSMEPWPQDVGPLMIAVGDEDQFSPLAEARKYAAQNSALGDFLTIKGCDHFFLGHLSALKRQSARYLTAL